MVEDVIKRILHLDRIHKPLSSSAPLMLMAAHCQSLFGDYLRS
jgi:hypothetical protein